MVASAAKPASTPHGYTFAPVKIGVLIDMDMGTKEDFLAALRFAFDEALADKVITRPVELLVKEAIGLPRLEAKNTIDGYLALVRDGVLCTIGPLITDNSLALAPVINATGVPADHVDGHRSLLRRVLLQPRQRRPRRGSRDHGDLDSPQRLRDGRHDPRDQPRRRRVRDQLPLLRRARRARHPHRGVHDADARRSRGDPAQDPRSAPRLPRLPRLRLPDHSHGADVHAPRLESAAHHDHGVSVLLRQARMDGGARRMVRHRPDVRGQPAAAADVRPLRRPPRQAARPHRHRPQLRYRAAHRRRHRARQPPHPAAASKKASRKCACCPPSTAARALT